MAELRMPVSRLPLASPAITRTRAVYEPAGLHPRLLPPTSGLEQPLEAVGEAALHLQAYLRVGPEVGVDVDEAERLGAGLGKDLPVLQQVRELEVREARLALVHDRARAPEFEVFLRQLEAVGDGGDDLEPCPGLRPLLLGLLEDTRQQEAGARRATPADPAAELVELREPEALRVLDEHDGGVRHVHPN